MKTINDLLDAIKQRRSLETDSALASALGVKRQTVNNWRQGRNTPDAVACATIAGLSGEPLTLVIGIAGEQRAVSAEEKKVWRRLAATALACLITVGAALPRDAVATAGWAAPAMHYAKLNLQLATSGAKPLRPARDRTLLSQARRASVNRGERPTKKTAITRAELEAMLASCDDSLEGRRDRSLLCFGFSSGRRRRSEIAAADMRNLRNR